VPPLGRPPVAAGRTLYGLSPTKTQFVRTVASLTGLEPAVVAAWVIAEGGPDTNPLNIGPGRNYGSAEQAARATANLINRSRHYGGIRAAARTEDPEREIAAIVASPWDVDHYRGLGAPAGTPVGTLLRGTYERIAGDGGQLDVDIPTPGDVADAVTEPIVEAAAGVQAWVQEKAALALAYVLLTGLSGALFVLGVRGLLYSGDHMAGQAFDRRVRELAPSGGSRGSGGDDEIPF
jgi:hypothetical protein